ncbi:uncharacterized protein LOC130671506 [Microplitis mediator]|uniref:uncharacterized protein LOC130671506 n=1 Tax=Microplitis mediator TaxID=375433 RepID=UPI002552CE97|nr:uncharacterized protein LOC130671506 [Microplitis mediator]
MPKVNISASYSQKYTKKWEREAELKGFSRKFTDKLSKNYSIKIRYLDWIGADPSGQPEFAYCKYCRTTLSAHKKGLLEHSKSKKHENCVIKNKSALESKSLDLTFKPTVTDHIEIAELKIAAFIAEHCSVKTVDHMVDILPKLDPSSDTLARLKLHRTKCTTLIKNVLGPCILDQLIEEIGDSLYSIIIDESTDTSTQKTLCVMLRFFSVPKKEVVTTFYRLIKIVDCDAKSVHQAIKSQLEKDNLKIQNMVGIGVDGASVMIGKKNSVTAIFKRELNDLIIMRCVCHSLHLCAEDAAAALPSRLEHFVREAHNYFAYSPKRIEKYKDLYETMNDNRNSK